MQGSPADRPFRLSIWYAHNFGKAFVLIFPTYLIMMQESGIAPVELASLLVVWSAGIFLFEVPSGVLGDLLKRRHIIVISGVFDALAFFTWLAWPTYFGFALGFFIWSIGIALHSGTSEAYLYECVNDAGQFEKVLGRTEAAIGFGVASCLLLGGYAATFGYDVVLLASIASPILASSIALFGLPHSPSDQTGEQQATSFLHIFQRGLSEVRSNRLILIIVCVTASLATIPGILEEYVGVVSDELEFNLTQVGIIYALVWLSRTAGNLLAHRFSSDRLSTLLGLFASVSAVSATLMLISPTLFVVGLLLYFLMNGMIDVQLTAKLQSLVADSYRATVTSFMSMAVEFVAILLFLCVGAAAEIIAWEAAFVSFVFVGLFFCLIWLVTTFHITVPNRQRHE